MPAKLATKYVSGSTSLQYHSCEITVASASYFSYVKKLSSIMLCCSFFHKRTGTEFLHTPSFQIFVSIFIGVRAFSGLGDGGGGGGGGERPSCLKNLRNGRVRDC